MKVFIAGSRDFIDYELLLLTVDEMLEGREEVEIVSGGAKGADALGERYAKERGYPIKVFPAEWNKYGRRARPVRNQQMADYADVLIAFWDGKSKGTKGMIELARKHNLNCTVKIIDKEA